MSGYRELIGHDDKPTVRLFTRRTPSGGLKVKLMTVDDPKEQGSPFRSPKRT